MVRWKGLEPPTHCLEGSCSIQLSYQRISNCLIMIPQEQDIVKHFFTNFSLWVYATQIYEPMLLIISLVGVQFIVSCYMVTSKSKNFSEELSRKNIPNFKDRTARLTRYYTVKAIIFIIPLLTFLLSKIGLVINQVCFFIAIGAYLAFMLINLYRHIRIKDFITSLCEYTSE